MLKHYSFAGRNDREQRSSKLILRDETRRWGGANRSITGEESDNRSVYKVCSLLDATFFFFFFAAVAIPHNLRTVKIWININYNWIRLALPPYARRWRFVARRRQSTRTTASSFSSRINQLDHDFSFLLYL